MHPDGSGDEQIWQEKILPLATSPDGRYLAATLPLEGRSERKLEIVDWAGLMDKRCRYLASGHQGVSHRGRS